MRIMRKSNFLKKSFSSVGTSSPHFRKRNVTLNIFTFLMLLGCMCITAPTTVIAQEDIFSSQVQVDEVSSSIPDVLSSELSDISYKLDDIEILVSEDINELQDSNTKIETLVGVTGHIFGALMLIIVCIMFIAIYKLFDKFFRF